MRTSNFYKSLLFFVVLFLITAISSKAAVNMSVAPIQGGTTLHFNRFDVLSQVGREVRIRLNSTGGTQYQVFQRWAQPLTSDSGRLVDREAVKFYALSGSSSSGTLYVNTPEYIGMSDQLVYTSTSDGLSDQFTLVYQVDPERLSGGGQLNGRLILTVRAFGAESAGEEFLDVFIEADSETRVSIKGEAFSQLIRLSTQQSQPGSNQLNVSFEANSGPIRFYQEVLTPLTSKTDHSEIPRGSLVYSLVGYSDGLKFSDSRALDSNRVLIYESSRQEDEWAVSYELVSSRFTMLKSGEYHGRIRFSVESATFLKDFDFDIEVEVVPVFNISFEFPEGPVSFTRMIARGEPQQKGVAVKVQSNLGQPYRVAQRIAADLRNEKGANYDDDYFLLMTTAESGLRGELKFPDFRPVTAQGDQTLFISNNKGDSAEFTVFYRLVPYDGMSPGDYRTEITYSLEPM